MRNSRNTVKAAAALGLLPLLAGSASALPARTFYLYSSSLGAPDLSMPAARTGAWGNGSVRVVRNVDFEGAPTLEITTRNLQEGGRFDLPTPLNLASYGNSGFLRLRVRFRAGGAPAPDAAAPNNPGGAPDGNAPDGQPGGLGFPGAPVQTTGGPDDGGAPPAPAPGGFGIGVLGLTQQRMVPQTQANFELRPVWNAHAQIDALPPIGGGMPPGMLPGIPPGMMGGPGGGGIPGGFLGGPGGPGGGSTVRLPAAQHTSITALRVTLVREQGVTSGTIPVDLAATRADSDGWRLLILPLNQMHSTADAQGLVERVLVTADAPDTFYLAQAAFGLESARMSVSVRQPSDAPGTVQAELTVKPGPLTLIADVEAGEADPDLSWNFDADNVGNLPPAAFGGGIQPQAAAGAEGAGGTGMRGGMPGGMGPGGAAEAPRGPRRVSAAPTVAAAPVPETPRIDSHGLSATFAYPNEEQNYRVEVTVRDRSGRKAPVTSSILIHVRG